MARKPGSLTSGDSEAVVLPLGVHDPGLASVVQVRGQCLVDQALEVVPLEVRHPRRPHQPVDGHTGVGAHTGRVLQPDVATMDPQGRITALNRAAVGLVGQQVFAGEATRLAYMTDEAVEGRDQFLEKREPDWSPYPWYY